MKRKNVVTDACLRLGRISRVGDENGDGCSRLEGAPCKMAQEGSNESCW